MVVNMYHATQGQYYDLFICSYLLVINPGGAFNLDDQ